MPENIIFLSPRDSDAATLVGSSSASGLPVTNLQDQEPTKKWRTTSTASQYVTIDFGAATTVAVNCAVMIGGNLSTNGTMRFRGASTAGNVTAAPSVDSTALTAWTAAGKPSDASWPHYFNMVRYTNAAAYRYWRIDFADSTPATSYFEFGRLVLGRIWQPTYNIDIAGSVSLESSDIQERTGYGQILTARRPYVGRRFDLQFTAGTQDEMHDGLMSLMRLRGTGGDVICSMDPAETTRFHWWSMQGLFATTTSFRPLPLYVSSKHMWGANITLSEKL